MNRRGMDFFVLLGLIESTSQVQNQFFIDTFEDIVAVFPLSMFYIRDLSFEINDLIGAIDHYTFIHHKGHGRFNDLFF